MHPRREYRGYVCFKTVYRLTINTEELYIHITRLCRITRMIAMGMIDGIHISSCSSTTLILSDAVFVERIGIRCQWQIRSVTIIVSPRTTFFCNVYCPVRCTVVWIRSRWLRTSVDFCHKSSFGRQGTIAFNNSIEAVTFCTGWFF